MLLEYSSTVVSPSQVLVIYASSSYARTCEMSEVARKAAASKIRRAIGIEVLHKQGQMMATLVQELRNEEQLMADFANGVV